MSTPSEYEHQVAQHFAGLGYRTHVTSLSGDYGLDVLAENGSEKVAIQAKLYGHTSRQVNRQMIMELHGVKDYFDCDRAVLATDGIVRSDAQEVATKLGIEVLFVGAEAASSLEVTPHSNPSTPPTGEVSFEAIWAEHIMPLAGTTISSASGRKNTVVTVDWGGLKRISSNGRTSHIDIEIFRLAINEILRNGSITRDEINQNYAKRASSAVTLILSQVPFFELELRPKQRLTYAKR